MPNSRDGHFAATRWSLVRAAAGGLGAASGRAALAALYEVYWRPVYAFCRGRGLDPADAEDATQEFYARLMSGRELAAADPHKGRFRAYLLTCLKHFLANRHRDAVTARRGGGQRPLSLDAATAEAWQADLAVEVDPDRSFERAWALTLLDRVLAGLREDYESSGRGEVFAALKPILVDGRGSAPYAVVAERLKTSEGAVKVAAHKLRQRYGELLRKEIAETVASREDVEGEIRDLFTALG